MRFLSRPSTLLLCYMVLQTSNQVEIYITRTETHRSSVFNTIYDYALLANPFSSQAAFDFFTCAQICVADSLCRSVNFHSLLNNSLCDMNTDHVEGHLVEFTRLLYKKGTVFGQLVNFSDPVLQPEIKTPEHKEYIFTTLGASGRFGPTDTAEYNATLLAGKITLNKGIQLWTVPETGNHVIEAFGASGANGTCTGGFNISAGGWSLGGLGARMKGTFHLKKGTKLKILVGQEGSRTNSFASRPGGGGGGTFVALDDDTPLIIAGGGGGGTFVALDDDTPLIIAGGGGGGTFVALDDDTPLIIAGGGGGGAQPKSVECLDGGPGLVGENGGVCGGSAGSGGLQCDKSGRPGAQRGGGTGAGFYKDGLGFQIFKPGSYSFIHGGNGGVAMSPDMQGSFGGGGFGIDYPGGGGGYSGGGQKGAPYCGQAGGGGSYNNGTNQANKEGSNKGDGKVIITFQ